MHRCEAQEIELEVEPVADGVALVGRDAIPLVDRDHERATLFGDESQQARVLVGDGVVGVDHADHDIGSINRL